MKNKIRSFFVFVFVVVLLSACGRQVLPQVTKVTNTTIKDSTIVKVIPQIKDSFVTKLRYKDTFIVHTKYYTERIIRSGDSFKINNIIPPDTQLVKYQKIVSTMNETTVNQAIQHKTFMESLEGILNKLILLLVILGILAIFAIVKHIIPSKP